MARGGVNAALRGKAAGARLCAAVTGQEIGINGFAASEAFLGAVPEADAVFAEHPTEVDFVTIQERGEVEETTVEVVDDTAARVDRVNFVFALGGAGSATILEGDDATEVDEGSAVLGDAAAEIVEVVFGGDEVRFEAQEVFQMGPQGGEEGFGLGEREVAGHRVGASS